jgi:DNA-binding transcriptional MocR family regulator
MDRSSSLPKVEVLVTTLIRDIESGKLRPGARLRSIRAAAERMGVSRNTVVEAYARLEARGYVQARPGSGYYVREQLRRGMEALLPNFTAAVDVLSLLREQVNIRDALRIGDGRLPASWMESAEVWSRFRKGRTRELLDDGRGYGDPAGFLPLRETLVHTLKERGVVAHADQVLMTLGANHALDLIVRHMLEPGDVALVDAPGYYPLFAKLTFSKVRMVSVRRLADGPDIEEFGRLLKEHRPKVFFTQSFSHNPTGSSISLPKAHRLLQLASNDGCLVVEDDPFADLAPPEFSRLAALDQLENVLYVSSFSKTLSAGVRVGYIAGSMSRIAELCDLKMVTVIATSDFLERMLCGFIEAGHYRRHMVRFKARLEEASVRAEFAMKGLGVNIHPRSSMACYMWLELPEQFSELELARNAADQGIFIAPGSVFSPGRTGDVPAMRVNVAYACDERFIQFMEMQLR